MAASILMLALWLGLAGASASEELHHLLHSDSHQHHHECLVTSFAKSQFLHSAVEVEVSRPAACFPRELPAESRSAGASDLRLAPGRAPPFASFLQP
jgi:hypothetical protein